MSRKNKIDLDTEQGVDETLILAQRKGFELAIVGRAIAVTLLAFVFLWGYQYPLNIFIWMGTMTVAAISILVLLSVRSSYGVHIRYTIFAADAALISLVIAFAPLSSGDEIPQNLIFLTSRVQYYYLIIAASFLALSPGLVVWTGAWCAGGLSLSTFQIMTRMDSYLTYENLPPAPSRQIYYNVVLSPNFISIESRIEELLIISAVTGIAAVAVHRARSVVLAMIKAESGRRQIRRLFGKYVPTSVIRELAHDGHIAPQIRDATLLIADIEGFTAISESMRPAQVVDLLNSLFSSVAEVVTGHGGVVVSYFGDSVIVAFNAPLPADDHAMCAVLAADDILHIVASNLFEGRRVKLRIGIATGPVAAGTVGSEDRLTYTLYGDTVNLAQRLEALNKELGTSCLFCKSTYDSVANRMSGIVNLGQKSIRNRKQSVEVFTFSDGVSE